MQYGRMAVPLNFPAKLSRSLLFAVIQLGKYLLSNSQFSGEIMSVHAVATITCAALDAPAAAASAPETAIEKSFN